MSLTSLVNVDPKAASVRDPLIGTQVDGRYLIARVHGRGGTSIVYAGMHGDMQCEVAIKVLDHAGAADPRALERFALEARLGSSLAHANVVGVSDFGHLPDGRPYLVMPMVAGIDMATLIAQEGPQHPSRVAKLLSGVASALDMMHALGLVHRDIKSENLMYVAQEDGTETVLVLDFGIAVARAADAEAYADSSGTPEFMPPEAWSGEMSGYRGDIYSLATVAFELMTGSLPFEGEDLAELRKKKTTQPARTLAAAGERDFPLAIEAVVARSLAQEPEARPASASEFVSALAAASEGMPAWTHRPAPRRPVSVHPTLVGTGSGVRDRASVGVPVQAPAKAKTSLGAPPRIGSNATSGGRAATLKRLSERAERFSSSTPAPPPLGAQAPVQLPKPAELSARLRALVQEADGSVPPVDAHAPQTAAPIAELPSAWSDESGVWRPQHPTLALQPVLDVADDPLRARARGGRLVAYAALAALVVVALAIWQRTRPAASPPVVAASTLAPAPVEAPPPAAPAAPAVPALPSAPEVPAVAAAVPSEAANPVHDEQDAPAVDAPNAKEVAPVLPRAAPERRRATTASHVSHVPAAHKKTATVPVLQIIKRPEADARPSAATVPKSASASQSRAKTDPDRARALNEQATDATLRSDFAAASRLYQEAIVADPGYAPAWRGKALVLERTGRAHDAAAAFRQFLKLAPNGAAADTIRARLKLLEATP